MNIDANDPKWTAYALGEITDAQDIAEIEKALEESPEMRELVEDYQFGDSFPSDRDVDPRRQFVAALVRRGMGAVRQNHAGFNPRAWATTASTTGLPSTSVITSPAWMPAVFAE